MRLPSSSKRDVRTQFGAVCYRMRKDKTEVLLVTSRTTERWITPKGWPVEGATPSDAAATEAWEEAGAIGKVSTLCLGIYSYIKLAEAPDETDMPCVVALFPFKVTELADDYPEAKDRRRRWCSPQKAATLVDEPELREILKVFDARNLPR
ncbi:NUDIX hydrolase [Anianabacter salinae]|uniref:NUDIX hydrolase n=1 Tax=Anianabacter salinae TaxID=2851023 RepID=UPI00225E5023|nr:NUDIX hydrolase [Anianabacter salinae]MBV0912666.1 NUDIX hydrolase [Anianabacter salinae]